MLGGLQASPASIPVTGGTQSWELDAGVANAGSLFSNPTSLKLY